MTRLLNMSSLNKSMLSEVKHESKKNETTKPSVWFQTAAGEIVELEYELGRQSPMICEKLKFGVGSTRSSPIYLEPNVKTEALELIFDYFRFHQAPGHSDKERKLFVDEFLKEDTNILCLLVHAATFLQLEELLDKICRAIARNIENSSPEVKKEFAALCQKSVERGGLNLQENLTSDLRFRLTKKLLAKQKKELKENVKKAVAEDRSIDDLISYINGGGDTKEVKTSNNKKNHKKRKEQKKTSSSGAAASTKASTSKKVIEKNDEDINASDSANPSGSSSDTVDLLGTQDESFNVNEDAFYDNLDPVKEAETTRMIEAFALSLNLYPPQIYGDPEADFHVTDGSISMIRTSHIA